MHLNLLIVVRLNPPPKKNTQTKKDFYLGQLVFCSPKNMEMLIYSVLLASIHVNPYELNSVLVYEFDWASQMNSVFFRFCC